MLFETKGNLPKVLDKDSQQGKLWAEEINTSLELKEAFASHPSIESKIKSLAPEQGAVKTELIKEVNVILKIESDKRFLSKPNKDVLVNISIDTSLQSNGVNITLAEDVFIDYGFNVYPLMSKGVQVKSNDINLVTLYQIKYDHTNDTFELISLTKENLPIDLNRVNLETTLSHLTVVSDKANGFTNKIENIHSSSNPEIDYEDFNKATYHLDTNWMKTIGVSEFSFDVVLTAVFRTSMSKDTIRIIVNNTNGEINFKVSAIELNSSINNNIFSIPYVVGLYREVEGLQTIMFTHYVENGLKVLNKQFDIINTKGLKEEHIMLLKTNLITKSVDTRHIDNLIGLVDGEVDYANGTAGIKAKPHFLTNITESIDIYPSIDNPNVTNTPLCAVTPDGFLEYIPILSSAAMHYKYMTITNGEKTDSKISIKEGSTNYLVNAKLSAEKLLSIRGDNGYWNANLSRLLKYLKSRILSFEDVLQEGADSLVDENGGNIALYGGDPIDGNHAITKGYTITNFFTKKDINFQGWTFEKYVLDNYNSNLGAIPKPDPIIEGDITKLCLLSNHISSNEIVQNLSKEDDISLQMIYDDRGMLHTKLYSLAGQGNFKDKVLLSTVYQNPNALTYVTNKVNSNIPNTFLDLGNKIILDNGSNRNITFLDNNIPSLRINSRGKTNHAVLNGRTISGKTLDDNSLTTSGENISITNDLNLMMRPLTVLNSHMHFKLSSNDSNSVYINLNTNALEAYGFDKNGSLGRKDNIGTEAMVLSSTVIMEGLNPLTICNITDGESRIYETIDGNFSYVKGDDIITSDPNLNDSQRVWGGSDNYIVSKDNGELYLLDDSGSRNVGVKDGDLTHIPIDGWVEEIVDDGFTTTIETDESFYLLGEGFNDSALGDTPVDIRDSIHTVVRDIDNISNIEPIANQAGMVYRNNGFVYYDHNNNSDMILKLDTVNNPEKAVEVESILGSKYTGVLNINNTSALWIGNSDNIFKGLDNDKKHCGVVDNNSPYFLDVYKTLISTDRSHRIV